MMRTPRHALALCLFPLLLSAAVPRTDYPQPQFQREQWMSLNGAWEFEFDDTDVGSKENWPSGTHKFSRSITVPYCFESSLSGIGDPAFHPYVWYRRSLTVPVDWRAKRVLLHFGAVDWRAEVYVNGKAVGQHEGGYDAFTFDITDTLKPGTTQDLVVAVWEPIAHCNRAASRC